MAELELIDRRALGIGKAKREIFDVPEYADGWNSAIEVIDNAPTIEAKPIVHAHWEKWGCEGTVCSNCYGRVLYECDEQEKKSKYCPHCGATMDGKENDNG